MGAFLRAFFETGIYKRTQGRITRQVTWAATAIVFFLGSWRLEQTLRGSLSEGWRYGISGALFLFGLWFAYRIVNLPAFADFLIAVEAEMNKVSWPTRGELFRGGVVVLVVIFVLALVLFIFDFLWNAVFKWLGILG